MIDVNLLEHGSPAPYLHDALPVGWSLPIDPRLQAIQEQDFALEACNQLWNQG